MTSSLNEDIESFEFPEVYIRVQPAKTENAPNIFITIFDSDSIFLKPQEELNKVLFSRVQIEAGEIQAHQFRILDGGVVEQDGQKRTVVIDRETMDYLSSMDFFFEEGKEYDLTLTLDLSEDNFTFEDGFEYFYPSFEYKIEEK